MTFGSRAHSARLGRTSHRVPAMLLAAAGILGLSSQIDAQGPKSAPGLAGQQGAPARSVKRLIRTFDFEEPNNPYEVPDHWFRPQDNPAGVRNPGFPKYNEAKFDRTLAASGAQSVRLPTSGGSTVLRLQAGEIPIFPDADYTVSVRVQTVGIEHARAFLTARLLDQRSTPIPGTEVRSIPVLSPGAWETVQILVPGNAPAAAWLQIDLLLLQPSQFEPPPPTAIKDHVVPHEDVSGSAYFDDVSVALVPRTKFWATQRSGIFVAPDRPTLGMLARDQGGEELTARVRVQDVDGRVVAQESFKLDPSARTTTWSPKLPGYGWFRAIMDIDTADVNVTRQEVWLCSLPERLNLVASPARQQDLLRFGLIADATPEPLLAQIPPIVDRVGTRFITLPAFDATVAADQARSAMTARAGTLEKLIGQGQQITLTVGQVPPDLATTHVLDETDVLGMCELEPKSWSPFMEPMLDVFGQQILRYQVGVTGDTHAMRRDPATGLETFERTISRLVPGPRIVLPWRADHPLPVIARTAPASSGSGRSALPSTIAPGPLVDELNMLFPLGFAPGAMNDLGLIWRDQVEGAGEGHVPAPGLTVVPELPEIEKFGARARAVEMARRTIEFWNAMGAGATTRGTPTSPPQTLLPRIAVGAPWRIERPVEGGEPTLLPGPALAVMSQMVDRLAGRRVVASVPAPAGVRALLLAEQLGAGSSRPGESLGRACVVAWNESAEPGRDWVDVYPARDSVDVVDMFGNTSRLTGTAGGGAATGAAGVQLRVPLTDAPVFIEGVDPYLAQFTSSFRLTPTFIPAVVAEHELRIGLTNPWPIRITGRIQLMEPDAKPGSNMRGRAWSISPNVIDFAIAPGQTASLPVTLSFGPGQLAGVKDLVMVARVLADRQYPAIRTTTSVEVGLPELELIPEVQLGPTPTGPDVIVIAAITNRDRRPRTLRVELAAPDTAGQQLPISDLRPAETVYKRFVLRDAAKILAGKHVRITLSDEDSAARLSKAAAVPDTR